MEKLMAINAKTLQRANFIGCFKKYTGAPLKWIAVDFLAMNTPATATGY
jgi:hypothetical protein